MIITIITKRHIVSEQIFHFCLEGSFCIVNCIRILTLGTETMATEPVELKNTMNIQYILMSEIHP